MREVLDEMVAVGGGSPVPAPFSAFSSSGPSSGASGNGSHAEVAAHNADFWAAVNGGSAEYERICEEPQSVRKIIE